MPLYHKCSVCGRQQAATNIKGKGYGITFDQAKWAGWRRDLDDLKKLLCPTCVQRRLEDLIVDPKKVESLTIAEGDKLRAQLQHYGSIKYLEEDECPGESAGKPEASTKSKPKPKASAKPSKQKKQPKQPLREDNSMGSE